METNEHFRPRNKDRRSFALDRVSGTRAKKFVEAGKALQELDGIFIREDYLMAGMTQYYIERGLKSFSTLTAEEQRDVLDWIHSVAQRQNNDATATEFKIRHILFKARMVFDLCFIEYNFNKLVISIENDVIEEIAVKELFDLYFDSGDLTNKLISVDAGYYLPRKYDRTTALKAAIGAIIGKTWNYEF